MPHDDSPADLSRADGSLPGLTACALCAGETLEGVDVLPGGQAERLRRLAETGVARLTFVDCLDECERGDVVVARPTAHCRRAGVAPVWFERLAGDEPTEALAAWLRRGGPGGGPPPAVLRDLVIDRGLADGEAPTLDGDAPTHVHIA
ncbi:hypothetical protein OMK64_13840 [Cellulomonas fimi]|uniref:hypothetical protein n=1 Tax=Cellulomonas fimi TaxID=1708 RepID=UPI00234D065C|nr:hypothetical protein [Cellulomonas fimi]MDC7122618.1 hypothetical protein [Cellulomonas fimi]